MAHQLGGGVVPNLNLLPLPPAAEVDRIWSLPEKARLHILSFLSLKTVIALGMVSRRWLNFVCKPKRLRDSVLGIHIRSARGPCRCAIGIHIHSVHIMPLLSIKKLDGRGRGPGHRLLCFILNVEDAQMRPADFTFLLDYAAHCDVEDVFVDTRRGPPALSYNFQRTSHHLVRLRLRGVRVDGIHPPGHQQGRFNPTLEVIRIHSTNLDDLGLTWILLSCTRLRVLYLRRCRGITRVDVTVASARLVSLTVAECPEVTDICADTALGLRSFRYRGEFLRSAALPHTCFGDLYISFPRPTSWTYTSKIWTFHRDVFLEY